MYNLFFLNLHFITLFVAPPAQVSSISKNEIETRVNILIKTPEIIWIENQQDANSNCLVLGVRETENDLNKNIEYSFYV
jgi:hypothetical protein